MRLIDAGFPIIRFRLLTIASMVLSLGSQQAAAVDLQGKSIKYSFFFHRCDFDRRSIRKEARNGIRSSGTFYFGRSGTVYMYANSEHGFATKLNGGVAPSSTVFFHEFSDGRPKVLYSVPAEAEATLSDGVFSFRFSYVNKGNWSGEVPFIDKEKNSFRILIGSDLSCEVTDSASDEMVSHRQDLEYKFACDGVERMKCGIYEGPQTP